MAGAHLAGDALALWLGYYWLGVGESRTSTLLWSFVVAAFTASLFCWLQGAGFVWGSQSRFQPDISRREPAMASPRIGAAFGTSLRNLPPLLTIAVLALLLYVLLSRWAVYSSKPAFTVASFLTLKLRKPFKPAAALRVFNTALWLVRWVVVPVLILPVVSAIATRGWRGFAALKTLRRNWRYWLRTPLLLLCALWLPFQLLAWTPFMTGFGLEFVSLTVRGLAAYLLFAAGLLAVSQLSQSPIPPAPR
jgi:hypothetical protein